MTTSEYTLKASLDGEASVKVDSVRYPFCSIPAAMQAIGRHTKEEFVSTFRGFEEVN